MALSYDRFTLNSNQQKTYNQFIMKTKTYLSGLKSSTQCVHTYLFKLCLSLSVIIIPSFSYAQAGALDTSFSGDGMVITGVFGIQDEGYGAAIQADGKIVVGGSSYTGSGFEFALVRYNSNGTLDNTFGSGGTVTTSVGSSTDEGISVAIQTDGKILLAGRTNNGTDYDFAIARFNNDGSLDNSFDTDGIVTTDFGAIDDPREIDVQSSGKIVVAGISGNFPPYDIALARYNSNGSLDTTFSLDGKLTTDIGVNSDDHCHSVAIQPADGKIVVTGNYNTGSEIDLIVLRYTTLGNLDTLFDSDGIVTLNYGSTFNSGSAIKILPGGKILIAGSNNVADYGNFALARFNSNGSLDSSFDSDGKVTTDFGNMYDYGSSVALQSDGKIVVSGSTGDTADLDVALARYNTDGSLDNSFDSDGKLTTQFGGIYDYAPSVMVQNDGRIVIAGTRIDNLNNHAIIAARYYDSNTTGLEELNTEKWSFSFYPNPVKDHLTINLVDGPEKVYLNAYDMNGKEVLSAPMIGSQKILDFSLFSRGVYTIQISSGASSKSFKVIKN